MLALSVALPQDLIEVAQANLARRGREVLLDLIVEGWKSQALDVSGFLLLLNSSAQAHLLEGIVEVASVLGWFLRAFKMIG